MTLSQSIGIWLLRFFIVIGLLITVVYWLQPDRLAAVTMVPAWFWLVPIVVILGLTIRLRHLVSWRVFLAVGLVFAVLFVEESKSMTIGWLRLQASAPGPNGRSNSNLRIVSFNGAGGGFERLKALGARDADVILLQESPGIADIKKLAEELYGDDGCHYWNGDTSIVARGSLEMIAAEDHFLATSITVPSGKIVNVVCLRLSPPVARLDFWIWSFWDDHLTTREIHRKQIANVLSTLEALGENVDQATWIIGGDFNSVARDGAFSPLLESEFRDSFQAAGVGYGATGTNESPLFRVDQIWVNRHLTPTGTWAERSEHSDHRMVVGEFEFTR